MTKMDDDQLRRRRGRNLALLGVLGAVAVLFYALAFVIVGKH
jgi:hypothetical protein